MRSLVPCSSCNRHVEAEAMACPFCGTALVPQPDTRVCSGPGCGHRAPGLNRAALAAVGATLLCASCILSTSSAYGTSIVADASGQTGGSGGQADAGAGGAGGQGIDAAADAPTDAGKK
jgi:hypothetical protein